MAVLVPPEGVLAQKPATLVLARPTMPAMPAVLATPMPALAQPDVQVPVAVPCWLVPAVPMPDREDLLIDVNRAEFLPEKIRHASDEHLHDLGMMVLMQLGPRPVSSETILAAVDEIRMWLDECNRGQCILRSPLIGECILRSPLHADHVNGLGKVLLKHLFSHLWIDPRELPDCVEEMVSHYRHATASGIPARANASCDHWPPRASGPGVHLRV